MCHVSVEKTRVRLHWIGWGYDEFMNAIIVSPLGNTPLANVKKLTNVIRCILICNKPKGVLLQVFADVVKDHGLIRFTKGQEAFNFFFFF